MPPASLSTLAVMKPGTDDGEEQRPARLCQLFAEEHSSTRSAAVPQHRDHVVGRDDAGEPAVLVDDRQRDQVVLVEQRRHFVVRRVGRARDVRLAQLATAARRATRSRS